MPVGQLARIRLNTVISPAPAIIDRACLAKTDRDHDTITPCLLDSKTVG
jgi:hypothetical protein